MLLLALAACSACYGRFILGPLQESLRGALTLTDNQMALLQGTAVAVPMALGAIPFGLWVDRHSRTRLIAVFAVVNLGASLLLVYAPSLPVLFLARALAGLVLSALLVAAYDMAGDLYGPAARGRATMVVTIGEISGAPAAFGVGGVLLGMAGSLAVAAQEAWRWAALRMSLLLVPVFLLLLALREAPRTGVAVKSPPLREVWPEFWRLRGLIVPLLLARVMVWIADGAVLVWGAPVFSRQFAWSPARIGGIMATALLISGLLGPMLGGPLADICQRTGGPRRTVTAICVLAVLTVPTALFALMPSPLLASVVLTAFLTLGFTVATLALTVATIVIPGHLRGLYIAVCVTVGATFCIGIAPLVVSELSTIMGGPAMIGRALAIVCCAASLVSAGFFIMGRPYFPRTRRG